MTVRAILGYAGPETVRDNSFYALVIPRAMLAPFHMRPQRGTDDALTRQCLGRLDPHQIPLGDAADPHSYPITQKRGTPIIPSAVIIVFPVNI